MATAFYTPSRPRYLQRHQRPKYPKLPSLNPHPHPLLRVPCRPLFGLLSLIFLLFCILQPPSTWNQTWFGMTLSENAYQFGPVRVDRIVEYDGANAQKKLVRADQVAEGGKETESNLNDMSIHSQPVQNQDYDQPALNTQPEKEASVEKVEHPSVENVPTLANPPATETLEEEQHINVEPKPDDLPPLKTWFNFTDRTAINFMHFHKTGGVSFKTALHKFYDKKYKASGDPVVVRDACYAREGAKREEGQPSFLLWRCDWKPIEDQTEEERNKHDFVIGHQFSLNGADHLLNHRDLRTFTVIRHPFDRKVSFFYHFFVREVGRKEEDVSFEEIRNFLLFDQLTIDADLGRDLGPNYMAGRMLSDGIKGFVGNSSYRYYGIDGRCEQVVKDVLAQIRNYVFVGLQSQSQASQCMLRKTMEEFNDVNGVSNEGTEEVDKAGMRLNSGSYSMSAKDIWARFSEEDRMLFNQKERVDLAIYEEGERLFKKHIQIYRCSHRLVEDQ